MFVAARSLRPVGLTNLRHHQLSQGSDELRRGIPVPLERLLVDHLTDGEPEGGFQALAQVRKSAKK